MHVNIFNVPYKESKVDFKTPELNDYVYVGYWIEHGVCEISIISESTDEIIIENIPTYNSNSSLDTSADVNFLILIRLVRIRFLASLFDVNKTEQEKIQKFYP